MNLDDTLKNEQLMFDV